MELTLGDIMRMFKRWKVLFLTVVIVTAIATVLIYKVLPKKYESTAILKIEGTSAPSLGSLQGILAVVGVSKPSGVDDYIEIMKSRDVLETVVKKLNLVDVFMTPKIREKLLKEGFTEDDLVQIVVNSLQKNLDISTVGKSSLVSVAYKSKDPKLSYDVVKALVDSFVSFTKSLSEQSISKKKSFLEEKIAEFEKSLRQQLQALVDFQKENELFSLEDELSYGAEALTKLKTSALAASLSVKGFKEENLPQGYLESYYRGAAAGALGGLISNLINLETLLSQSRVLTPRDNLQIKALEERISDLKKRIAALKILQAKDYESTLKAYMDDFKRLLELEPEYYFLQSRVELLKTMNSYVWQQYFQTLLSEISLVSPVTVVSAPKLTHIPTILSTKLVGAIGLALGLFLGILAVFWRESTHPAITDYSIYSREKGLEKYHIIRLNHLKEDVEKLALKLKDEKGALLVASPNKGDGKTSITRELKSAFEKLGADVIITSSESFESSLREEHDFVIVEAPAFSTDPLAYGKLTNQIDRALIVIGEMNTTKAAAQELFEYLGDKFSSVLVIFNKVRWVE